MADQDQQTKTYEVTKAREIAGAFRKVGETIDLLPRQAKYYLAPYGEGLQLPKPEKAAKTKAPAGNIGDHTETAAG